MITVEPWRCDSCKALMYDLDEYGYPTKGAPLPHYWNTQFQRVCSMCWQAALKADTKRSDAPVKTDKD